MIQEAFEPNPDYWTALLWKQLMGTNVLNTSAHNTNETSSHLRHYAHCSTKYSGGVTLVFINLAKDLTYEVIMDLIRFQTSTMTIIV